LSQSKSAIPEPTEIAGRYQVIQKLGAGAFGTVYKAKDKILGRMLAIKTIRLEGLAAAGASLDEMLSRFKQEAQVSAQLKHPNIVTVYDIGDSDGMSYLAMEFIDGVGLEKMILSGRLPIERAASLGAQVADALGFAHSNGIIHRDIKPANIMVEAGDRAKVTDFGIAKLMDSGDHLTMTGSLLGTPSYMSPEQARGGAIDGRSDLFSLGCVIYEMLAGRKAFRGESITALIFKIITEEPPPIREMGPDLPDEIVRIIARALAKAPDARYQSGREMAEDLLAFTRPGSTPTIRQLETTTAPGSTLSPTLAPTFKGPAPAGPPTLNAPITMSVGPTVIGAAAPPTRVAPPAPPTRIAPPAPPTQVTSAPPRRSAPPARTEAPRKSGGGAGLLIGLGLAGLLFMGALAVGGWYLFLRKPADVAVTDVPPPTENPVVTRATEPSPPPPSVVASPIGTSPATVPALPSAPAVRPTEPPPTVPRAVTPSGGQTTGRTTASTQPRSTQGPAPASEMAFLDNEEPVETMDGRAAGETVAKGYRSDQGQQSGGNFGATGRLQRRERNPRPSGPLELSAIKTLRYLMDNQEALRRKSGHYGNFSELFKQTPFDTPHSAETFQRRGYRYALEVASDGFKITALPVQPGPRAFRGDDSGYILPGVE
jgi:serine/threonine-protein kinase